MHSEFAHRAGMQAASRSQHALLSSVNALMHPHAAPTSSLVKRSCGLAQASAYCSSMRPMSPLPLYCTSCPSGPKTTSAMEQSHSTLSSIAFRNSSFFRRVKATCTHARTGKRSGPCILVITRGGSRAAEQSRRRQVAPDAAFATFRSSPHHLVHHCASLWTHPSKQRHRGVRTHLLPRS